MAASIYDPRTGAPIFFESGAPEEGADLTEVARFAAANGNRLIGTAVQRAAYAYPRRGLEWYDISFNRVFVHTGTAWVESLGDPDADFVAIFETALNA